MYIYPENLKAKAMLWLWELKDVVIIGVGLLLSVFALAHGLGFTPLLIAAIYAFLSIRMESGSILDYLRYATQFLFLKQQYFEWRVHDE